MLNLLESRKQNTIRIRLDHTSVGPTNTENACMRKENCSGQGIFHTLRYSYQDFQRTESTVMKEFHSRILLKHIGRQAVMKATDIENALLGLWLASSKYKVPTI